MDGEALFFGLSLTLIILFIIIGLLIGAFFLWLALRILGIPEEKTVFKDVFVTQIINVLVGLIPIIGCILQWYFIKTRHTDSWGSAIVAWILAILIPGAIAYGIAFAMGALTPTPAPTYP